SLFAEDKNSCIDYKRLSERLLAFPPRPDRRSRHPARIGRGLGRVFARRPWREFLVELSIVGTGLYFEGDRIHGDEDEAVPGGALILDDAVAAGLERHATHDPSFVVEDDRIDMAAQGHDQFPDRRAMA